MPAEETLVSSFAFLSGKFGQFATLRLCGYLQSSTASPAARCCGAGRS